MATTRSACVEGGEPTGTLSLRLRSADSPAVAVDDDLQPLAHDPESRGFGLIACRTENINAVRGAEGCGSRIR